MSYFSYTLPTVITEPGQYVTRCGETVTITQVGRFYQDNCWGSYANGIPEHWHCSGRIFPATDTRNDIVRRA